MTNVHISPENAVALASMILAAGGCPEGEARHVAHHLVDANLTGHDSHGLVRVPQYLDLLQKGVIKSGQHVSMVRDSGAVITMDGNFGFGQVAAREAIDVGIERAREHGVCFLGLRNVGHLGRLGAWAEQAADAGMVSLHFGNSTGFALWVAPTGGTDRRLSVNPISGGAPRPNGRHVIIDFATTEIPEGKVRIARNKGVPLPTPSVLDSGGVPTTDPAALYGPPKGALIPFAGHKGFGLNIIADLLAGALSGGECTNPENESAKRGLVNCLGSIIINPDSAGGRSHFHEEAERFIEWVKQSPPKDPERPVIMPGEPEWDTKDDRSRNGITIDAGSWQHIREAGERAGLSGDALDDLVRAVP